MRRALRIVALGALGLGCGATHSPMDDAGPAPDVNLGCHDMFRGGVPAACCPSGVDCTVEPDGYPGYECVEVSNQFCSCACSGGSWQCAC